MGMQGLYLDQHKRIRRMRCLWHTTTDDAVAVPELHDEELGYLFPSLPQKLFFILIFDQRCRISPYQMISPEAVKGGSIFLWD